MGGWPMVGFLLFSAAPLVMSILLGFTELHSYDFRDVVWIGFRHYKGYIFDAWEGSQLFRKSILNTLYGLISVFINMFASLVVATVISTRGLKGRGLLRTAFFLPTLCGSVATTVFLWFFDGQFGILNSFLRMFGMSNVSFLMNSASYMPIYFLLALWTGMGPGLLFFMAALTNVNDSVLEAAKIDGAGTVRRFFKIIIPYISPTMFFVLTTNLITGFQMTGISAMNSATLLRFGPYDAGITAVLYSNYIFNNLWSGGPGEAAAVAMMLAVVIIAMTLINFRLGKRWVAYD